MGWADTLGVRQYPKICLRKARTRAELAFWASNMRIHEDLERSELFITSRTEWFLMTNLTNRLNLLQGLSPLAASSDNALAAEGTTELSMDEKFSALQVWTGP